MRYAAILVFLHIASTGLGASLNPTISINDSVLQVSNKVVADLNKRYCAASEDLQKQSVKALRRMQKYEADIKQVILKKNSSKAALLFGQAAKRYAFLQTALNNSNDGKQVFSPATYIPGADSMSNALRFLAEKKNINAPSQIQVLNNAAGNLGALQNKLQMGGDISAYMAQRQSLLKAYLSNMGVGKQLLSMNKTIFYYQQQLAGWKALVNDRDKLSGMVMDAVKQSPGFSTYMSQHSYLAGLFPGSANAGTAQALTGLQTQSDVQSQVQHKYGKDAALPAGNASSGSSTINPLSAENQFEQFKTKLTNLGITSSPDAVMPDFTPNGQKNKSIFKRLEYGFNIQNQQGTFLLPAMSDLALTLGYKINDKVVVGIGASGKIGWGENIGNIHVSSQGLGLRSFADIKIKGRIWLTGAWEYNYYQAFSKLADIPGLNIWQRSALLGITQKYSIGKKNADVQLLYDFLAAQQVPRLSGLKFRIGYTF